FNRVVPLLALVFIGELLGAVDLSWSPLANVAAVAGGIAILLVAIGAVNRARARPFFAVPETVGVVELTAFVVVPALLPLIFGGPVIALGSAFLVARLPREVRALERDAGAEGPALDARQRLNVGLVLLMSQALQVLFVSLAIGAFFVALGLLIVDQELLRTWI